ncbi:unnamed protein product [Prorocentrum cordatum]|uniref:Kinetochore protein Nuf2 N-terminal domain-containing protein n=1 Tax=Prorocentrum cordatum TaxID=2364126 RepID=A0ABN9TXH0_9DINO|nr:unnamed protein product [Polarella glacialis]
MVGMRGYAFRVLAPKDIAAVLGMIGVHPAVTPDAVDKPTLEVAMSVFQHLVEFAYDMDVAQVKAQTPHLAQPTEIFDEATDVLTVFKLAKQLAAINLVDDFSLSDIWEPSSKRFRAVLSGIVNFCRYKEAQVIVITGMKADLHSLDAERLELVERTSQVGDELNVARERHNRELQDLFAAESDAQEAQGLVDKLRQQRHSADRLLESKEAVLGGARERAAQNEQRWSQDQLREADLRDQIAESPEGLEREVRELHQAVRQQKGRLEERVDEKRARAQRNTVLGSLAERLKGYKEDLAKVHEAAGQAAAAKSHACSAGEELAALRRGLEAQRAEEAELDQAVKQTQAELEKAKQAHEGRLQQLEARRRQALLQHQELQARRTEEQRQLAALQARRLELDAEVAGARRAHEAEMNDLRAQLQQLREEALAYVQGVEAECEAYSARISGSVGAPSGKLLTGSPEAKRAQRRLGYTPSPQRVRCIRQPLVLSPGA